MSWCTSSMTSWKKVTMTKKAVTAQMKSTSLEWSDLRRKMGVW